MTEREIATQVLSHLRANLPGAVVVKHNDVGTKGIPDIQIARADRTCWAELKHLPPGGSLKKINKAQQLLFCHELATVNNGRCWVLVFETTGSAAADRVSIWQPHVLFRFLWPAVAGPSPDRPNWKRVGVEPLEVLDSSHHSLAGLLHAHGAIRTRWSYDLVTRLVKDAVPY